MKLNSLAKGSAQIRQKDSGAGCAVYIICDNIVIVVLTMGDLTLSVFCQKNTPTECHVV